MRNTLRYCVLLVVCLLLPYSVIAADKVVVVPLNTGAKQTQPDQYITNAEKEIPSGSYATVHSPPCPEGYRLTGGGYVWSVYVGSENSMTGCRPVMGETLDFVSGANAADRYLCQGSNDHISTRYLRCFAVCILIPGR